jgi:hypothetical protein
MLVDKRIYFHCFAAENVIIFIKVGDSGLMKVNCFVNLIFYRAPSYVIRSVACPYKEYN